MEHKNWEEEMAEDIGIDINNILDNRGIYDCGKNFQEDVLKVIIPRITAALTKQREEIVQKILKLKECQYAVSYDIEVDKLVEELKGSTDNE